jgi:hypothetical protein
MNWLSGKRPKIYKSTTLVEISPLKVAAPDAAITKSEIDRRLNFKLGGYFSRPSLEHFITKHNLFVIERERGTTIEFLAEKIRRRIEAETESASNNKITSFRISYISRNLEQAQTVTSVLVEMLSNPEIKSYDNSEEITVISYMKLPDSIIPPNCLARLTILGLFSTLLLVVFWKLSRSRDRLS